MHKVQGSMFNEQGARSSGLRGDAKAGHQRTLIISNLHYNVSSMQTYAFLCSFYAFLCGFYAITMAFLWASYVDLRRFFIKHTLFSAEIASIKPRKNKIHGYSSRPSGTWCLRRSKCTTFTQIAADSRDRRPCLRCYQIITYVTAGIMHHGSAKPRGGALAAEAHTIVEGVLSGF